jgi:hypothetical protein
MFGVITTFAGNGTAGFSGDGGMAASAELNSVHGLALDAANNLHISDNNNRVIRMVNGKEVIQTVVGTGLAGFSGDLGSATLAALDLYNSGAPYEQSRGSSIGNGGAIYIPDMNNQRVRIINAQQTATLIFQSTPDDINSAPRAVNIPNTGNVSLDFSSFTATSGYVLQTATCRVSTPLLAGNECGLNLLFEPVTGAGTLTGKASMADNAPSSPHTISTTATSTLFQRPTRQRQRDARRHDERVWAIRSRYFSLALQLLIHAAREEAAIHHQDLASDEAACVTGEKNCRAHQLFGLAESIHRGAHSQLLPAFTLIQ